MDTPPIRSQGLPDSIGPYRLGERLGRGGMGEVFRGYDARLDRPVALKRVRPGVGDPDLALARFRREARAAARLRHPAIVQVHDWVETADEAWLVMEMVEGRSLREVLQAGALAPERVVGFARDLLEGLAAAHEAGFVHRDLKAENVMMTSTSSSGRRRGEQARILDFGLAKLAAHETGETQLSIDGKIVGTLSALAPEQVLGQKVDARTDLFALGCLLYEALTGRQPFVGASAGETLNRISSVLQAPAHQLRADVSPLLSAFVDHLLEKDPRRRPPSAHAALDELERVSTDDTETRTVEGVETVAGGLPVAAGAPDAGRPEADQRAPLPSGAPSSALGSEAATPGRSLGWIAVLVAVAAIAGLGTWRLRPLAEPEPTYVVVPETVTEKGAGDAVELAAKALHTALVQGLVDLRGVAVLDVPDDEEVTTPRALIRALAADEAVTSRLDCGPQGCRAEIRRLDGTAGRVIETQAFSVDPEWLLDLSQAAIGHLRSVYPEAERPAAGGTALEVRPVDYETFLRLFRRFKSRDRGLSSTRLISELESLGASSPRFAAIPILEAHVALQRHQTSGARSDLEHAERAVARARALAPKDSRVLMLSARAARQGGDLEAAGLLLDQVWQLEPGNTEALFQLAVLDELEGRPEQAAERAREAVVRRPSRYLLFNTADLFYRQGDFDEARRLIERGLELAPENFKGLSRLAQLELAHGDLERAATLYGMLVERSPEAAELTNLGTALMMLGRFDEAADCFERMVSASPSSPYATLSLADVEKLSGGVERAGQLYERVLELAAEDPRPDRLASVRAQALAHLGRHEEAVEAIQTALRHRPDQPWVAYEAALVYTLIGDQASAQWNVRRALAGGIAPRWFSLVWFDPVRGMLEAEGSVGTAGGE